VLDLARAIGTPDLQLIADSGLSTCSLGLPAIADARWTLDLHTECRALLRFEQYIRRDDVERLRTALLHELPPDCATIDLEIGDRSLTLCAWDGDQIVWYDGAVLHMPVGDAPPP
jgi:hypothetical protein